MKILRTSFNVCKSYRFYATAPASVESSSEVVIEQRKGKPSGIFVLGLNRANVKNALSKSLARSMKEKLDDLRAEKSLKVLIVRSLVRGVFCAGADLKERLSMPLGEVEPFVDSLRDLTSQLYNFDAPTICALDGIALGGGMEIALACDIRIASSNAKMGLVETKLAIIPGAGGTQRLSRIVGPSLAKELIFTARIMDGQQANAYGIVNHVVEQNQEENSAFNKALEIAEEMASNGPKALRLAKFAVNKGIEVDINTGLDFEKASYAQVIPTYDRVEGLKAFLEKRAPKYTGE